MWSRTILNAGETRTVIRQSDQGFLACVRGKMDATLPVLSPHRRVGLVMLLGVACFVTFVSGFGTVFAANKGNAGANFMLSTEGYSLDPQTSKEIDDSIAGIKQRLSEVQCGGWNRDVSVGSNLGQYISKVLGVPGREGDPLGNIESGMARRRDEFLYPAGAQGKVTACKDGTKEQDAKIWCQGDPAIDNAGTPSRNCTIPKHPYPYIMDPYVCLWRGENFMLEPPLSEAICRDACDRYMNDSRYTFADCKKVEKDAKGIWKCVEAGTRAICSDDWIDTGNTNCKDCSGGNCRCPGPGCQLSKAGTPYRSFVRKYSVQSGRLRVNEVPKDVLASVTAQVQCYGFYREFDALTQKTELPRDARCVIGNIKTAGLDYNPRTMRKDTQKGKGKYMVDSALPDTLPGSRSYNAAGDVWFTKIMGAFSFLRPKQDLATALLSPEKARLISTVQNTVVQPLMAESTMRAIDDTASNNAFGYRPFTAWWQKFVTDGQRVFTPPVVRLRLPATWNQPIAALNPILVTPIVGRDRRTESIEVQLQAKDDLAGIVADQLKRALMLEVREEPVPIVVPMGSPVEFRAIAQQWEEYRDRRRAVGAAVPGEVDALIIKLQSYASSIESVRTIRAQLPLLFGVLLDKQADFLVGINAWAEQNRTALLTYTAVARQRAQMEPLWEAVVAEEQKFSDVTNFPWCRNDRFTTPIYTLLDPWYPDRPHLFGGVPTCAEAPPSPPVPVGTPPKAPPSLPILCVPQGERELVYDLSQLKVTTGSIILPVLKPLQVRIEPPKPPSLETEITDTSKLKLPDFPKVPDITKDFELSIPTAQTLNTPRSLPKPVTISIEQLSANLIQAQKTLKQMNDTYAKFWRSLVYENRDEGIEVPKCPTNNGEVTMGQLDCCGWNDRRCAHTEVDLLERVTRITARPAVFLKEDFYAAGYAQTRVPKPEDKAQLRVEVYAHCNPTDITCQPLLPAYEIPADGWQIIFPQKTQTLTMDLIRAKARAYTLKTDGTIVGSPPLPFARKAEDLYSSFTVPRSYDLRVPKAP